MAAGAETEDSKVMRVCGWVSGRNAYGGMTGFRPFIGVLMDASQDGKWVTHFTVLPESSPAFAIRTCAESGAALAPR